MVFTLHSQSGLSFHYVFRRINPQCSRIDVTPNALAAIGELEPTANHEAHHIIPGKGRHLQPEMMDARLNLHAHGIGINDPQNGVWLMNFKRNKRKNWDAPQSPGHRELHRYNYENWISINFGLDTLPKDVFVNRLHEVKWRIKNNSMPAKVMEKKDVSWSGHE